MRVTIYWLCFKAKIKNIQFNRIYIVSLIDIIYGSITFDTSEPRKTITVRRKYMLKVLISL